MSIGFLFWLLFILWIIFGVYWNWPTEPGPRGFGRIGGHFLIMILLFLLGWKVFGFIIQGGGGGP